MARRLPSLNALKAFEAAARHVSFTEAAGELFVTHAAISRHIRELEEYLGTQLFLRTGRGFSAKSRTLRALTPRPYVRRTGGDGLRRCICGRAVRA